MSKTRLFFIVFPSSARVWDTNLVMLPTSLQSTPDQETLIKKVKRKFFLLIKLHADVKDYAIWVLLSDMLLTLNFSSVILSWAHDDAFSFLLCPLSPSPSPPFLSLSPLLSVCLSLFKYPLVANPHFFSSLSPRSTSVTLCILFP